MLPKRPGDGESAAVIRLGIVHRGSKRCFAASGRDGAQRIYEFV
jgi:hypothetical protein